MGGHSLKIVHGYGDQPAIHLDNLRLENVKSYEIEKTQDTADAKKTK